MLAKSTLLSQREFGRSRLWVSSALIHSLDFTPVPPSAADRKSSSLDFLKRVRMRTLYGSCMWVSLSRRLHLEAPHQQRNECKILFGYASISRNWNCMKTPHIASKYFKYSSHGGFHVQEVAIPYQGFTGGHYQHFNQSTLHGFHRGGGQNVFTIIHHRNWSLEIH